MLDDKIAHILDTDSCKEIVNSSLLDLENVCEGDCVPCRTRRIVALIKPKLDDLQRLKVPCDNNIRYKFPKDTFDEILKELETEA